MALVEPRTADHDRGDSREPYANLKTTAGYIEDRKKNKEGYTKRFEPLILRMEVLQNIVID